MILLGRPYKEYGSGMAASYCTSWVFWWASAELDALLGPAGNIGFPSQNALWRHCSVAWPG
jgi:hypothetical protein